MEISQNMPTQLNIYKNETLFVFQLVLQLG